MKLVLLGTGGYFPTTRRHTACFMLPEVGVVLDAGTGMCRLGAHLKTDRLDIFLTHCTSGSHRRADLPDQHRAAEVLTQTTVHGEAAKLAAVRDHLFAERSSPSSRRFDSSR